MNANYYVDLFEQYGIDAYWIPVDIDTQENADDPAIVNLINQSSGLFFSGGDQSRYLTSFMENGQDTLAMAAIRQQFNSGSAVIAGSSAGTAVMADTMITSGTSYNALRYGAYVQGTESDPDDLTYTQPGFALFNYGLLDTHFAERGRQGRIIELANARNLDVAWGVDEETALLIQGADGSATYGEVIGVGGVHRFDLSQARFYSGSYELYDVSYTYGTDGDLIDLQTGLLYNTRTEITGSGRVRGSNDVFSTSTPRALIDMAIDLAQSGKNSVIGKTAERRPRYEVRLSKTADFYAFGSGNTSFDGMRLDMFNDSVTPEGL
jgi:cyanophycinase